MPLLQAVWMTPMLLMLGLASLSQLKLVQNSAACLLTGANMPVPILASFHWLCVAQTQFHNIFV